MNDSQRKAFIHNTLYAKVNKQCNFGKCREVKCKCSVNNIDVLVLTENHCITYSVNGIFNIHAIENENYFKDNWLINTSMVCERIYLYLRDEC